MKLLRVYTAIANCGDIIEHLVVKPKHVHYTGTFTVKVLVVNHEFCSIKTVYADEGVLSPSQYRVDRESEGVYITCENMRLYRYGNKVPHITVDVEPLKA